MGLILKFVYFEVRLINTVEELGCEKVSVTLVLSGSIIGGMGIFKTEFIGSDTSGKVVVPSEK